MTYPLPWLLLACLFSLLLAPPSLPAQTVAPSSNPGKDAPNESNVVTLSPFEVTSDNDNGYQAANTLAATRTNTPIRDLPMHINVLNEQLMTDRAIFDLDQALDALPGTARVFDEYVPKANIRGFNSSAAMRNGVRSLTTPDTSSIERVEVVKGPAALIYGQTQPGGVINYITKNPSSIRSNKLSLSAGSNQLFRAEIESTGPLNASKTLNYRVGATYYHTDNGERQRTLNRYAIAPMLQWKPTDSTNIVVRYSQTHDWIRPAEGLAQKPGGALNRGGDASRFTYIPELGLDPADNPVWVADVSRDFYKDSPASFRDYKPRILELEAHQRLNDHMDLRFNFALHERKRQSVREGGTGLINPWTFSAANIPKVGGLGDGLNGWNLDGTPGDPFPEAAYVYGLYGRNGVPSTGIDPLSDTRLIDGVPYSDSIGAGTLAYIPGVSGWRRAQWNGENRKETRGNGQVDLVSRFKLGALDTTLLTGFERNEERSTSNGSQLRYDSSASNGSTITLPGTSVKVHNYVEYWYNIFSDESTAARDAFASRNIHSSLDNFTGGGSGADNLFKSNALYANWAASFHERKGRFSIGGRYDDFEGETRRFDTGTDPYILTGDVTQQFEGSRDRVTPQLGLSYRVADPVTLYALYSESIDPRIKFQPLRTASNETNLLKAYADLGLPAPDLDSKPWAELLEPEYGTSYEVGLKADLFDRKLSFTVALFTIERHNISQNVSSGDPDSAVRFQELIGAMRARGVDTDFYFRPMPELQIGGGFLYNDTEILEAPDSVLRLPYATTFGANDGPATFVYSQIGRPIPNAAKWSGNGFIRYEFSAGKLKGFGLGAYYTYIGDRVEGGTSWSEGWDRIDLNFSYRTKIGGHATSFALVVKNLADKFYRVDRDTLAQGRSFVGTTSIEF